MGGGQILRGSTLREMHRVQWIRPDWKGGWGLGFSVAHRDERDLVGHGGWLAGYQTALSFSPREKIAMIAMCNADDALPYVGQPDSVIERMWRWVAPAINEAARVPPEPPRSRAEWHRYVGKYRSRWGDTQIFLRDGALAMIDPTEQDPAGTLLTLIPQGRHTFRTHSEGPFVEDGDTVRFEMGPDGHVAKLWVGENYSLPVR